MYHTAPPPTITSIPAGLPFPTTPVSQKVKKLPSLPPSHTSIPDQCCPRCSSTSGCPASGTVPHTGPRGRCTAVSSPVVRPGIGFRVLGSIPPSCHPGPEVWGRGGGAGADLKCVCDGDGVRGGVGPCLAERGEWENEPPFPQVYRLIGVIA